MATPSSRSATKRAPARGRGRTSPEDGSVRSVRQVIDELDRMRDQAGEDLRGRLDAASSRMREVAEDLRERADERSAPIEQAVSRVADEAWLQIATLAIRAQHDVDALTALSAEVRKRKAQLRQPAKRKPAARRPAPPKPASPTTATRR